MYRTCVDTTSSSVRSPRSASLGAGRAAGQNRNPRRRRSRHRRPKPEHGRSAERRSSSRWSNRPAPPIRPSHRRSRRDSPGAAVTVAVGVLGERVASRWAECAGRVAERDDRHRTHRSRGTRRSARSSSAYPTAIVVSAVPRPSAAAASSRFCTAGKIDSAAVSGEAALGVGADDDVDGRGGDATGRAPVDVGEECGGEAVSGEVTADACPRPGP